jgi:sodium/proline symporter
VVYCFAGGLRASIWTDAAQSIVMIVAMAILIVVAVVDVGGPAALFANLRAQDPSLVRLLPGSPLATVGFVAGFMGGGLAAVGQPHIVIRTMALRDEKDIAQTRRYYFAWFIPFSIFALGVGLAARAVMPHLTDRIGPTGAAFTPEHALPALSLEILPAILVGLMLAGVFAATMSTADSQILSCSAAVTQDVFRGLQKHYWAAKGATLSVALLALGIALYAERGVFDLVLMAWSVLGATIGPLILLRVMGRVPPGWLAALMMASGVVTVSLWTNPHVFDVLPGMIVPLLVYAALVRLTKPEQTAPAE